jgi:hypothetical protein
MANLITTDPLILDTAATIAFTRPILAKRIEWYVPTTVGHQVIVTDLNSNVIVEGTCEVISQSQILWSGPQKLTLPGFVSKPNGSWQVTTIQSGKLIIWF